MQVTQSFNFPRFLTIAAFSMWCAMAVSVLTTNTVVAAEKANLLGDWTLNRDLTEKRRPKLPKAKASRSGFGKVHVGVGGVLVPTPGSSGPIPGGSGATAGMPKVLSCDELELTKQGQVIEANCPTMLNARKFNVGNIHGRKTKYSNRKLTEKYSSSSRRVTHTFKMEGSDRMEVKVTVKPKGAKLLTYILVFDRTNSA